MPLPKSGSDNKKTHNHDDFLVYVRGQCLKQKRSLVTQKGGDENNNEQFICR